MFQHNGSEKKFARKEHAMHKENENPDPNESGGCASGPGQGSISVCPGLKDGVQSQNFVLLGAHGGKRLRDNETEEQGVRKREKGREG